MTALRHEMPETAAQMVKPDLDDTYLGSPQGVRPPLVVVPAQDPTLAPEQIRERHIERLSSPNAVGEQRFERITTLACTLFGVPVAAIRLIGANAPIIAISGGSLARTLRSVPEAPFAECVVEQERPVVVEDATTDARFATTTAVAGRPFLRLLAGVPLADDYGVVIGAFCIYDTVPRHLDGKQLKMLEQLAEWAARELVETNEMTHAREVQNALLPSHTEAPEGYELAAVCRPTKSVGGDFFDHGLVGGGLIMSLVDVMGKGVGAALVAASVRAILRASMKHQLDLAAHGIGHDGQRLSSLVAATDALLADDLGRTETLVTGFGAFLNPQTHQLDWVDAGHGLAVVVRADGSAQWLSGDDVPLGLGLGVPWTQHSTTLEPGDMLVAASDGLFDMLGGTNDAFDQIVRLALLDPDPKDLITRVTELSYLGMPVDDVTAVALRRSDQ